MKIADDQKEWVRRASVSNAIASAELEGVPVTQEMRNLLERTSRDELSESEIREAILAIAFG